MKQNIQDVLDLADIKINRNKSWDIQVHNPKLYARVLAGGSLAFGESYMDGWWDCKALDRLFDKVLSANLDKNFRRFKHLFWDYLKAKIMNLQNKSRA